MSTQPNSHETSQRSGGSSTLIIILAILVILMAGASGFLGWLYLDNSKVIEETKTLQLNTLKERDSIDIQLTNLQAQFDLLRETQSKSLDSVIQAKNLEIEALRMQNRSAGMGSGGSAKLRAEVKKLKEELAALLAQINQLKSENSDLKNANEKLNSDILVVRDEVTKLTTVTKELNTQVDIAKQIKISAIKSNAVRVAKNGKEKETDKSKKANKISSCFTVFENDVVEKGDKDAHLVIIDPTGKILGKNESRSFELDGSTIYYTAQKGFYFDGRKVEMCMDYTDLEDLPKGSYKINVYIEQRLAAKSNFDLK
jgi:predicted  nucleic acid-binding Zn-ribbon protein